MGNGVMADFPYQGSKAQNKWFCPFGHEILEIRGGVQVMQQGIIFSVLEQGFCCQCRKVYDLSSSLGLKPGQTHLTVRLMRHDGKLICHQEVTESNEFISSTLLGVVRKVEEESKHG